MELPKIEIPALRADGTTQRIVVPAGERAGVLIVDDTPAKLVALAAIVSGMALEIVTATSGEQALRQLLKRDFAVILLDVNMPMMDGFETATLIRSRPRSEHTPIIFVTAEANSEAKHIRGYTLGAVDFIYSPIIPEILRAKVRVFVDLFYLQRQVLLHNEHLESLVAQRTAALTEEIAERKRAEEKVKRLNRVYAVLSRINGLIVRVKNRQDLFDGACRIAVEHGQFEIAWIGVLDPKTLEVSPAAFAGIDVSELLTAKVNVRGDVPEGQGETGRAIREKRPVFSNNIALESGIGGERRKAALQRGLHSIAALPLLVGEEVVGNLTLFAKEPDFFNEEELLLLTELAGDISFALDHIEKAERLDYLAYYDVLTGLPNRTLFYDRANQLLHAAKKHEDGRKVAVVVLDLERFHVVNETLGRGAADALLKQVAERLSGGRLGPDHLARISADTFAAVLGDLEKEEEVVHFVEQGVIGLLEQPFSVDGQELKISARAGIALFPADGADADALFRNAEAALKNAKLSGDRYLFYTPELNARLAGNLALEHKLRRALERGELALHHQPKIDLKTGRISGLEALMRWNDPEAGLVPPVKFIPILEETGLILEAGRWALEQAVADFRRWRANGLAVPRISVNVSAIQLRQKDFVAMVERALSGAADAAGVLELEITESLIMQDVEANIQKLKAIREMGVEVAIDDFGTGYSSLAYIARLPVHTLKIDRAFIMNLTSNPGDVSIVTTIISLAHSLNLKVVAEGVETEEQAKLLRLLKCDEMQGYLFSPAVSAERIEVFLKEGKSLPR